MGFEVVVIKSQIQFHVKAKEFFNSPMFVRHESHCNCHLHPNNLAIYPHNQINPTPFDCTDL